MMEKLREENAELKRRIAEFERKEKICLQTEAELARKNAELEAILDAPRDSVIIFDRDGIILDCNKTFTKSSGLRKEEIIGKYGPDFYPPEIREERKKLSEKVFETGKPIEFIDERDGKYFDVTLHPIFDEKGDPVKTAAIARDVTHLKKTQIELQKNSAFLEAVFEGMPGMALIVDKDNKILNCNKRFFDSVAAIGFDSKNDLVGKTCYRILKNLDDPCPHCKIHEAFDSGKGAFLSLDEDPNRIAKGAFDVWYRPIFDSAGNVIAALEIAFDVTDKKRSEKALRNSEAKHRALFENMTLGVVHQDANGKIIEANKAAERILGLTRDQLLGKTSYDPDWQALKEDGSPYGGEEHPGPVALRTGKVQEGKPMGIYCPDTNAYTWIEISAYPIFGESKTKPEKVYTIFEDVTEKRKVREALVSFNKELQKMTTDRDKLLSVIAHDLRSPVAGLASLTREMHENIDYIEPEELSELIAALNESSSNLYKLLDNLLHWALIGGQSMRFRPERRNIADFIRKALELVSIPIQKKKLRIENLVDPELRLKVDPNMFEALIRNLLSNSVKFCEKNGRITISSEARPNDTIIEIEDDGVGMTPKILDSIFDVMNKTSESGTSGEKGSGLGLVLCREYMQMHGGDIEIDSVHGEGSKVTLVFPE